MPTETGEKNMELKEVLMEKVKKEMKQKKETAADSPEHPADSFIR